MAVTWENRTLLHFVPQLALRMGLTTVLNLRVMHIQRNTKEGLARTWSAAQDMGKNDCRVNPDSTGPAWGLPRRREVRVQHCGLCERES